MPNFKAALAVFRGSISDKKRNLFSLFLSSSSTKYIQRIQYFNDILPATEKPFYQHFLLGNLQNNPTFFRSYFASCPNSKRRLKTLFQRTTIYIFALFIQCNFFFCSSSEAIIFSEPQSVIFTISSLFLALQIKLKKNSRTLPKYLFILSDSAQRFASTSVNAFLAGMNVDAGVTHIPRLLESFFVLAPLLS